MNSTIVNIWGSLKKIATLKIDYLISTSDSLLIKGIAICFMLFHHLFTTTDYGTTTYFLALSAKVCVSMFIFISAYGLTVQYENELEPSINFRQIMKAYAKRYFKLYLNFWSVFICFVPIGIFFFGRTLADAYGQDSVISGFLLDIVGLASFNSYNITWWFYKVIIILYLLFPILYLAIKKIPFHIVALALIGLSFFDLPIENTLFSVGVYHRVFVVGIVIAMYRNTISKFLNKINYLIVSTFALIIVVSLSVVKYHSDFQTCVKLDIFTCLAVLLISIITLRKMRYLNIILIFLGTHSMNIFMIHTFLYLYFLGGYIYSAQSPVIIFITLLAASLALSLLLEFIKTYIGLYRFSDKILSMLKQ